MVEVLDQGTQSAETPPTHEPAGGLAGPRSEVPLYTTTFFLCMIVLFFQVAAFTLLFHFPMFLEELGANRTTVGTIAGVGMVAGLTLRLVLGQVIDHVGPKRVWVAGNLIFTASVLAFMLIAALGPAVYLLRGVMAVGWTAVATAGITYVSALAPPVRRAEAFGTYGIAGFSGMIFGPQLGDLIFSDRPGGLHSATLLFVFAGALTALAAGAACLLPPARHSHRFQHFSIIRQVREYWPGPVAIVAIVAGLQFAIVGNFLRLYVSERHLSGIGQFFLLYPPTAIAVRVVLRRLPQQFGRRRTLSTGLFCYALAMASLTPVSADWHLAGCGVIMGLAHALTFPSLIDLGSERLPGHLRGAGINLMLGCQEVGMVAGSPILGWLADTGGFTLMFLLVAAVTAGCGALMLTSGRPWVPPGSA